MRDDSPLARYSCPETSTPSDNHIRNVDVPLLSVTTDDGCQEQLLPNSNAEPITCLAIDPRSHPLHPLNKARLNGEQQHHHRSNDSIGKAASKFLCVEPINGHPLGMGQRTGSHLSVKSSRSEFFRM